MPDSPFNGAPARNDAATGAAPLRQDARRSPRAWFVVVGGLLSLTACSASHYRQDADDEVYDIIANKREEAGFEAGAFSIEPPEDPLRARLLAQLEEFRRLAHEVDAHAEAEGTIDSDEPSGSVMPSGPQVEAFLRASVTAEPRSTITFGAQDLGEDPRGDRPAEMDALVLDLAECLEIAAENSRDYQREKENVYLAALNLTFERHLFKNRYFGSLSGTAGQDLPEERSVSGSADAGFTRNLASGATVLFDIGATLFRTLVGDRDESASSLLSFAITQPLLRGAGRSIVLEPLTQAERDAIYAIRSFERFKRELAVRIASDMYRVLQTRDQVDNARTNYDSLVRSRERIEALAEAGRTPQFQVDQAEQDELRARDRWVSQIQSYETALDRFKITLGLPPDAVIEIDPTQASSLAAQGIEIIEIDRELAVDYAIANRLDLANTRDSVEDAERRVNVTEDALQAALSIGFSANVDNEDNKLAALEFGDGSYLVTADLDLPFDRKSERNAYRSSIISLERARRTYEQAEDNVKFDVRAALRELASTEESYRIQLVALELAERRVESTELLQQAGRASTRDLLEAQEALLETQDGLTAALTDHTISRLELLRDMGLLYIDQEGLTYDASTDRFASLEE